MNWTCKKCGYDCRDGLRALYRVSPYGQPFEGTCDVCTPPERRPPIERAVLDAIIQDNVKKTVVH